ncbi:MFS transporter [Kibdelosporangium philippinense]|uniref:MFS transporter n=1 Tax=Kibdelosporangium philippinense TaxID=211113 RepID=A0ABS8Z5W1_9PSEU|nr:MFS transporter [Kibdelosporangium philippinense]MCE7002021.1 MFS transporter [Kibdelosporangium philippinense]
MRESSAPYVAAVTVAVDVFALVTTEFLPLALLPRISADIGVTTGQTGLMVKVPGLTAASAAPAIIALAWPDGSADRAVCPDGIAAGVEWCRGDRATGFAFEGLLAGRVLLGIGVSGFCAVGGSLGPRLRPEVVRATSIIYPEISAGAVAGLPAGALPGNIAGWRLAFVATPVLAVGVVAARLVFLPPIPAQPGSGIRAVPRVLRVVYIGLIATFLGWGGNFAAYTYTAPMLATSAHIEGAELSAVLLAYGIAGFVGAMVSGWAIQRAVRGAVAGSASLLGAAVLVLAGSNPAVAIVSVMAWGFTWGVLPIAMQTLMFDAVPDHPESVTAAFGCLAHAGLGTGALVGGLLTDHIGLLSALVTGGVCTCSALFSSGQHESTSQEGAVDGTAGNALRRRRRHRHRCGTRPWP